ncbi:sensor histidine kinase [Bounagaea algeriensis]
MTTTAPAPRWLERASTWSREHPLTVDGVIAAVLVCLAVPAWPYYLAEARMTESPAAHASWIVACSALLAHGAIVVRRVRPAVSFTVVSATTGLQLLGSVYVIAPSVLLFLVSLYSYCTHGRRPAPAIGLATGVGGAVVVAVAGFALAGRPMNSDLLMHVFVRFLPCVVAAWSLGMFRRIRVDYVAALEERALRAEAEREQRARRAVADERSRIAREMHDIVAHALSVVISQANGGRYAARADPEQGVEALTTIAATGKQALADMRGILTVLRHDDGEGASERFPQPALTDLPELYDRMREAGVPVEHHERGTPRGLSRAAELAVFRLVQEGLTNTLKHAGPGVRADVGFTWNDGELAVTVGDNGLGPPGTGDGQGLTNTLKHAGPGVRADVGFTWNDGELAVTVGDNGLGPPGTGDGQGLIGMRERLAVVGGSVLAGPDPAGGFRVRARIPLHADTLRQEATR